MITSIIREAHILSNTSPPDQLFALREGILEYLDASQFASWNILKKNINSLYITLYENEKGIPDNLEYKVLYPLLKTGRIETARRPETGKLVYCGCPQTAKHPNENSKSSLVVLKKIPSFYTVITHWQKSETEVHYIYEQFDKKNHFKTARDTSQPHIYTSRDRVYSNKYIRLGDGSLYRIPEIEENIDGLNIACCYLESIKGHSHFTFNETSQELSSWIFHTMLPIVVCRALILCDPMVLVDGRVYNNGKMIIRQITNDHITELKRIFGESAVEVKHG
jgi:hypothetical protein